MNISDMLKKKKNNKTEDTQNSEIPTLMSEDQENVPIDNDTEQEESNQPDAEEKLKAELIEASDKYLRLYAEFDNFKRRTSKERVEMLQTAGRDVIADLLTVLDDFERASKAIETATDIAPVKEGITLVHSKLKNILMNKGLKEMNAKGTTFDADLHEAITNIPAPSDDLRGKVIDEVEKGYSLNDKVIRFAKVVVGA
ncbi:MAG TPA: nucleotide exchange factor GrpE [Sphingobacteriaceae bacterium]|nr:nucleotide exchange factor GrpE [Sphingobacteriaceae bacterium]